MSITLGYVDAVHHGTTAPTTTNIIWFKTNNNDPNTWVVIDILFYYGGAWRAYYDLFFPVIEAEDGSPPDDERAIWRAMSGSDFIEYRVHDGSTWIAFLPDKLDKLAQAVDSAKLEGLNKDDLFLEFAAGIETELLSATSWNSFDEIEAEITALTLTVKTITAGKTFSFTDGNTIQSCTNNNQINLQIPLDASVNFATNVPILIERNGVGKVVIYSPDGVTINGVNQNSFEIKDQFTSCYIRKKAANEWVIMGNVE